MLVALHAYTVYGGVARLGIAAQNGHAECVAALLEAGATR